MTRGGVKGGNWEGGNWDFVDFVDLVNLFNSAEINKNARRNKETNHRGALRSCAASLSIWAQGPMRSQGVDVGIRIICVYLGEG